MTQPLRNGSSVLTEGIRDYLFKVIGNIEYSVHVKIYTCVCKFQLRGSLPRFQRPQG